MKGREKESLEPVVSESVQVPATQATSEKVTNAVGTFCPRTAKAEPEKVANMVGTFLIGDSKGSQIIKVTTKWCRTPGRRYSVSKTVGLNYDGLTYRYLKLYFILPLIIFLRLKPSNSLKKEET